MVESILRTHYFDNCGEYRQATKRLAPYRNSQAIGVQHSDGSSEIFINRAYYLDGRIFPEQLQAIIVHEMAELAHTDNDGHDAHDKATVAEYQWIYDTFGAKGELGLLIYHGKMNTLMGAIGADARNRALVAVLGDKPYAVKE